MRQSLNVLLLPADKSFDPTLKTVKQVHFAADRVTGATAPKPPQSSKHALETTGIYLGSDPSRFGTTTGSTFAGHTGGKAASRAAGKHAPSTGSRTRSLLRCVLGESFRF